MNWINFHKEKPDFVKIYDEIKYSEQVFFCINDKLYLGYYVSELFNDDITNTSNWDNYIEIAHYSLIDIIENYLPIVDGVISCNKEIKKYDIYWSKIDMIDILLNIDLLKKKEKENEI